ncbi:MAG: ORF6N domain-containing protein, partial [Paramuribaculum sp.]|nr:ORF6N domain-containing protein [Paramuribaculum sp.]
LSSVLNSKTAIQINMGIMRAFVAARQMIAEESPVKRLSNLEKNFNELKQDLEEIFADYNDINEDTRAQIEAINTTLAELQRKPANKPRRPVGFIRPKE